MCLKDAPSGTRLKILGLGSDFNFRMKLFSMGLHVNDLIIKLNDNKKTPVLIKNISVNSTKVALGKDWATNIIVENV